MDFSRFFTFMIAAGTINVDWLSLCYWNRSYFMKNGKKNRFQQLYFLKRLNIQIAVAEQRFILIYSTFAFASSITSHLKS